jgi:hypothetical protein
VTIAVTPKNVGMRAKDKQMIGFSVPSRFNDVDFMGRIPLLQRFLRMGGKGGP